MRDLWRIPSMMLPALVLWGVIGWMTCHVI